MRDPNREKYLEMQREVHDLIISAAKRARAAIENGDEDMPPGVLTILTHFVQPLENKTYVEETGTLGFTPTTLGILEQLALEDRQKVQMITARDQFLHVTPAGRMIEGKTDDDNLWDEVMS